MNMFRIQIADAKRTPSYSSDLYRIKIEMQLFFGIKNIYRVYVEVEYSGDLNSELVRYSNGPKQFAR